ncbi:MAG: hypothetical protein KF764_02745, partial [Labilithrix sp.]|nr:hypothetical protein [Labilithrix sp.]
MKAPPSSVEALSTDVGPANAPRVVVGMPTSDPPPADTGDSMSPPSVETKGAVDGLAPAGVDPLDALETLERPLESEAPPVVARVDEAPATDAVSAPEKASLVSTLALGTTTDIAPASSAESADEATKSKDLASTLVFGSAVKVEDDAEPPKTKQSLSSTLAMGSTLPEAAPKPVAEAAPKPAVEAAPQAVVEAAPQAVVEAAPKPLVEAAPASGGKKNKKKNAAAKQAKLAAAVEATDPDEVSVPPIGDVGVDEQFFSEGDVSRHLTADAIEGDALTIVDKAKRKSEPQVVERRARFVRYVKWAVAGAAVVCLAAVARTSMSTNQAAPIGASAVAAHETPAAPKAATPLAAPLGEATPTST